MSALLTSPARPVARIAQVSSVLATSSLKPFTPLRPAAIRRSLLVRAEQQTDSKDSYQVCCVAATHAHFHDSHTLVAISFKIRCISADLPSGVCRKLRSRCGPTSQRTQTRALRILGQSRARQMTSLRASRRTLTPKCSELTWESSTPCGSRVQVCCICAAAASAKHVAARQCPAQRMLCFLLQLLR